MSRGAFRNLRPYLWVNHFQGLGFPYKEKTTLPEAGDDVCDFVSVASFGVTCEGNREDEQTRSLLAEQKRAFESSSKIEGNSLNWQVVVMMTIDRQT